MRRKAAAVAAIGLGLLAGLCWVAAQFGSLSFYPPVPHKAAFDADTSEYPSPLQVSGNRILNAEGETVLLRGVMPSDPAVFAKKELFEQSFFAEIAATGANVVRIPVHPERWEHDPDYLWRYLDPVVQWAGENNLYAIIDLHFIGNIETSSGAEMPDIAIHSKDFALDFWRQTAAYFKDAPHMIFEIFNEPAGISTADWRASAEMLVAAIRETGAQQIIIVGGVEYSRDLSWVLVRPIPGENIAYAAHIYPGHGRLSWDGWFGEVAKRYPVLMTEWGWVEHDETGEQPYLVGTRERYGEPLMAYLDERSIGWVACWYDDEWQPAMFDRNFLELNSYGQFVTHVLQTK